MVFQYSVVACGTVMCRVVLWGTLGHRPRVPCVVPCATVWHPVGLLGVLGCLLIVTCESLGVVPAIVPVVVPAGAL